MATNNKVEVIRLSDNLLKPDKWVAEIHKHPNGNVFYAVQFVGRDEGTEPTWHKVKSVRAARNAIKLATKENHDN